MKRILVTGASGQLGQEFGRLAMVVKSAEFVLLSRSEFDICMPSALERIHEYRPEVIVNCAAYTAVDLAQNNAKDAFAVNATAVKNLACAAAELDIPMIHFSSDYVYHNNLRKPLKETDPTRPKGVYAKSKLKGEKHFLASHDFPMIIRVSWLYSEYGHNFPKTIINLAAKRDELNVVNDQIGAPTNARDLAAAVWKIIEESKSTADWNKISGIYNYSNDGTASWYEIAKFLVEESSGSCRINPIPSKEFPTAAPRPRYSKLNLSKFKATFHQEIRHWRDSMADCLKILETKHQ
ncbi:MAG: dTDP-4-dehydrorhamnose reductase [Saprospiraceae bacterium]|nr:dTDP-4-dehydrorhamnose reductase [Saprospiraceae bacterium]